MTRKRILALMLTTLYVFCCFFTNAYSASNGSVSIVVGSVEGTRGEIVNVPVSFKGLGSQSINNCDFRLKFDSRVLEVVEVTPGVIVKNADSNFSTSVIGSNNIYFLYVDNSEFSDQITSDGLFANVKFRIKTNAAFGNYPLRINDISFGDMDQDEIKVTAEKSMVSVVSNKVNTPTPTKVNTPTPVPVQNIIVKVGSVQGKVGQTVTVPISFIGVSEIGLNNCEFTVSFDSTKLKFNSVVAGSIIKNSSDFNANSGNGFVKIVYIDETQGVNQITKNGIFANLNFTIKDEADSGDCPLNLSEVEFADNDLNLLSTEIITGVITVIKNPAIQDMNVVIGIANGYAGEIVTIPISFGEVPEKGVDNCDFTISYDARVLEAVDVKAGSIVESAGKGNAEAAGNFSYNVENIGKVMLMYTDNKPEVYPMTDRGEFAKVIFKIKTTALTGEYPIMLKEIGSFTDVDINDINAKFNTGSVKVAAYTPTPTLTPTPTPTIPVVQDMNVVIGSAKGYAGEIVTIPISFGEVPEKGIDNCDFTISYDARVLEAVDVKAGSIVESAGKGNVEAAGNFSYNVGNIGKVMLMYTDNKPEVYPITGRGEFAKVIFKIKTTALTGEYHIMLKEIGSFTDVDINDINAKFNTGSVKVAAYTPTPTLTPTPTPTIPVVQDMNVVIGSAKGYAGETVTIPISFEEVPEKGIDNCDFTISYDDRVLEAVDVKAGSIVESAEKGEMEAAGNFSYSVGNIGKVMLMYTDNKPEVYPITDRGEFAKVIFKIKATALTGGYPIMLKEIGSFTDVDLDDINAKFNTGSVRVAAYTPTPTLTPTPTPTQQVEKMSVVIGSAKAAEGQTVSIPVNFKCVPSVGINNCDFRLSYDASIFEVESVKVGDIVPGSDDNSIANIGRKGEICFAWFAYVDSSWVICPIKSDGLFATINLKVKDGAKAGNYEIKLLKDDATFADTDLSEISTVFNKGSIDIVQSKGFGINIGNVTGVSGETVTVPISFKNVPTSGVNNCDFDVLFNSDVFELVKVEAGSIVPSPNMNFVSHLARQGDVRIVFVDVTQMSYPIKNDGVFANVSLKIKENVALGANNIEISNIELADSDLSGIIIENTNISGKLTVGGRVTAQ